MSQYRFGNLIIFLAAILLPAATTALAQDNVQSITMSCQASLREIAFWCVTIGGTDGAVSSRVEQENNCREAKQLSDRYRYPLQVPQLG